MKPDWRTLPRKPAAARKSARLHVRLPQALYDRLAAEAAKRDQTLSDYVLAKLTK